jgi:Bacterial protein of unknown function (DUF882)
MTDSISARVFVWIASVVPVVMGGGLFVGGTSVARAEARSTTRETAPAEFKSDARDDAEEEPAHPPRRAKPAKRAQENRRTAKPLDATDKLGKSAAKSRDKSASGRSATDKSLTGPTANPRPLSTQTIAVAASKPANKRSARQPTPEYRRLRDAWHAPVEPEPILDLEGRPPLTISPVNGNGSERVSLVPARDDGGFDHAEQQQAALAFTPVGRTNTHAIAPHLLDLVYRAMRHFHAPLVHLVSGYRRDRAGSRHSQGRAIDFVVPGVSNEELAKYVRKFGFVGVGIYPKSGFVHLDVRESSYFWVDESLPDERSRCQPILGEQAEREDAAARQRGESPDTFVPGNDREDRAAAIACKQRAERRRASAGIVGEF